MPELGASLKEVLDLREKRDQQLVALLDSPNDLIAIVLRAHLIAEELLTAVVASHCANPIHLERAKLRFPQLVALARAFEGVLHFGDENWKALEELNALRNSLAHVLEPSDVSRRVEKFIATLKIGDKLEQYKEERARLQFSVSFLMGALSVSSAFHAALELLILHRVSGADGATSDTLNRPDIL